MADTKAIRLAEDGPIRFCGREFAIERGEERHVGAERAQRLVDTFDHFEYVDDSETSDVTLDEEGESDDEEDLEELDHDELKQRAEEAGIAEEIDLRQKETIVEALEDLEE